ncbi:MAG TPA: glycosyltransferase [Segetibacter sp.]|nr:glycosyltransferase [Segetibacter sp.]
MINKTNITILIAPLDWGLGHATRCIPIINFLILSGCKVVIAAEGSQEKLLRTEFPTLIFVRLPGYRIKYSKSKRFFILKIALQIPKILININREKRWLQNFLKNNTINAVISDNRYGLFHSTVTSVFITHQLLIKAPFAFAEKIMQQIHYHYIKKFSLCWIPDEKGIINLAGDLSHPFKLPELPVEYIGGVSRFERQSQTDKKYDVLILISGPEPQRTVLEKKMLNELKAFKGKVLIVRGLPGCDEPLLLENELVIKNHLPAKELEKAMNESEYIISRSGYTTIMDICKLGKKSILIPTPGQTEQEYLANHLQKQGWCLAESQENFSLEKSLQKAQNFKYNFSDLKMESYKEILTDFIDGLRKKLF